MGAIVGSFLNVCIVRIPMKQSIAFPSSHCMQCLKPILWHDNIPIVSFFALGGKCRHCHARISWQYPLVEAATALIFTACFAVFGFSAKGIFYMALSSMLLVESVIDTRFQIIPDKITLPGILAGLLASTFFPSLQDEKIWRAGFLQSLLGILLGGGILFLVATVGEWFFKKEAMGGGDLKLLAMIGAFTGWKGVLWTLFAGSFVGAIFGLYQRIKSGKEEIPFGPYLAAGAFLYLFLGQRFFEWYAGLIGFAG